MKCIVTYNCGNFSAAANRCAHMMARGLAANGNDVDFVVGGAGRFYGKDHEESKDYRFRCLASNGTKRGSLLAHYRMMRSGIIGKKWDLMVFYSVGVQFVPIISLAKKHGLKTIYVQGDHYVPLPGMTYIQRLKVSVINAIDRYLSKRADLIALTGTSLLFDHYRRQAKKVPIYISYPPIDAQQFASGDAERFREKYRLHDKKVIAYCGGIASLEGVEVLVRSMQRVARCDSKAHLVIAGKLGVHDHNVKKQIDYIDLVKRLGIQDRVTFTGFIPQNQVRDLLLAASILVMPKLDHHRNRVAAPIKLTEYFSAGKPVVATAVGDVPVRFENGLHLCLSKPGDMDDLAAKILELLESPETAERIGMNAQAYARQNFDYKSWGYQVLNALS